MNGVCCTEHGCSFLLNNFIYKRKNKFVDDVFRGWNHHLLIEYKLKGERIKWKSHPIVTRCICVRYTAKKKQKKEEHINLNFIICWLYTPHKLISSLSIIDWIAGTFFYYYFFCSSLLPFFCISERECPNISTHIHLKWNCNVIENKR